MGGMESKARCNADRERPLKNVPFCPISALGSDFNPRNTLCMSVVARSEASALYLRLP